MKLITKIIGLVIFFLFILYLTILIITLFFLKSLINQGSPFKPNKTIKKSLIINLYPLAKPTMKIINQLPTNWRFPNQLISLGYNLSLIQKTLPIINTGHDKPKKIVLLKKAALASFDLSNQLLTNHLFLRLARVKRPLLTADDLNNIKKTRLFINHLDYFLGLPTEKHFYFIVQNNCELRPSGGFMGSLARLDINQGQTNLDFLDIYQLDGNLPGHVQPPTAIQQAFHLGFWQLRDANWKAEFPLAAKDISWFLSQSGAKRVDGIVALNYSTIEKIIDIVGPIYLPEDNLKLKKDNFFQLLHQPLERNFYPGSQLKSRLITLFGFQLWQKIKKSSPSTKLKLIKLLYQQLNNRQILVYFPKSKLENISIQNNWAGTITYHPQLASSSFNDFSYLVESNLSANKLNCYLEKEAKERVFINPKQANHIIKLSYYKPKKVKYLAFFKLFLPATVQNIFLTKNNHLLNYTIQPSGHQSLSLITFWLKSPTDESTINLTINYSIPINKKQLKQYSFEILNQPGNIYPYHLEFYNSQANLISTFNFLTNKVHYWQKKF